jgi:cytochrome P450
VTHSPRSDVDLFADPVLENPFPVYEQLREMGPAVYLDRHQVWAIPRHEDADAVLRDDEVFSSVNGLALTPEANATILAGTVLASDGREHARLRRPLSQQLNPRAMQKLSRDCPDGLNVEEHARQLVAGYVAYDRFDAAELAQHMVADVVMRLMGLPDSVRKDLLNNAKATFNLFGPANARYRTSQPAAAAMLLYLNESVRPETVRPGSWIHALYQAAENGTIDEADVVPLMNAYTTAGMDTTILALTTTIHLLTTHPQQWAHLRTGRATAEAAVREALRLEAPIQGFGRRVARDTTLGGTALREGEQVWVLYGSAGRDPRKWGPTADEFDIRRPGTDKHLALGAGRHECAGNHLALLQASAVIGAMASHHIALDLEPARKPVRLLNNVLRGFASVPVRATPE